MTALCIPTLLTLHSVVYTPLTPRVRLSSCENGYCVRLWMTVCNGLKMCIPHLLCVHVIPQIVAGARLSRQ